MGLLFSAALILAGLAPVVYFLALVAWQFSVVLQGGKWVALPLTLLFSDHALLASGKAAPVLPFIPQLPWIASPEVAGFLNRVHVGLIPALLGLALIALGVLRARRRITLRRERKQREADRLRRMRDYRRDPADFIDGRREPFISTRRAA